MAGVERSEAPRNGQTLPGGSEYLDTGHGTLRYWLSKFARKYKKALVTTAAFAVLLVAGMVLNTLLAVWATSAEAGFGTVKIWETSVSPEVQGRRAARQLVADLFGQVLLRAAVLERLRTLPGMSPSRRQEAITVVQAYPENPETLNNHARERVRVPGGEMAGYRKPLRCSEEACRLKPKNGDYLNTLGVAYYRLGNYEKALETLRRAEPINKAPFKASSPADLAFLAMKQQRLGHAKEARAEFQRLRERMKDPRWARDAEAQAFLREAEAVLAKPKTPRDR